MRKDDIIAVVIVVVAVIFMAWAISTWGYSP